MSTVPFTLFKLSGTEDHIYTADPNEKKGDSRVHVREVVCRVMPTPPCAGSYRADCVPIYRYHSESLKNHFYTINPYKIGSTTPGQCGQGEYSIYKCQGTAGYAYLYQDSVPGLVPLYCLFCNTRKDHLYTTEDINDPGFKQRYPTYKFLRVACYVYPK